jgi:hypothetical protein
VIEQLPSKNKTLSPVPSIATKGRKEGREGGKARGRERGREGEREREREGESNKDQKQKEDVTWFALNYYISLVEFSTAILGSILSLFLISFFLFFFFFLTTLGFDFRVSYLLSRYLFLVLTVRKGNESVLCLKEARTNLLFILV